MLASLDCPWCRMVGFQAADPSHHRRRRAPSTSLPWCPRHRHAARRVLVEEIQFSLCNVLNVNMEASAYLDGQRIEDKGQKVEAGQRIEFLQEGGRKGIGKTYTKEEFMLTFHMSESDWSDWIAKGVPFDTMRDGTIVISETEVDHWKEAQRGHEPENHVVRMARLAPRNRQTSRPHTARDRQEPIRR